MLDRPADVVPIGATGSGRRRVVALGLLLALLVALAVAGVHFMRRPPDIALKGYDITETGLRPRYPEGLACSPLTSLYASWIDVDGSERDEIHSGVDGGRLGDPIYAPGPGVVRAVWVADWGWGKEGALLIAHSARQLNLEDGAKHYYSAFYHLDYDELKDYEEGEPIERGQVLAHVFRPGGKKAYLPEVHWEVYEARSDVALRWHENERKRAYFTNRTSRLIDPLYMLSREPGTLDGSNVEIVPYRQGRDYAAYRGFTYILPCAKKK
jgi:murein DD-endopeptidase MepM/ murein hydrolase activator NlpD